MRMGIKLYAQLKQNIWHSVEYILLSWMRNDISHPSIKYLATIHSWTQYRFHIVWYWLIKDKNAWYACILCQLNQYSCVAWNVHGELYTHIGSQSNLILVAMPPCPNKIFMSWLRKSPIFSISLIQDLIHHVKFQ